MAEGENWTKSDRENSTRSKLQGWCTFEHNRFTSKNRSHIFKYKAAGESLQLNRRLVESAANSSWVQSDERTSSDLPCSPISNLPIVMMENRLELERNILLNTSKYFEMGLNREEIQREGIEIYW